MKRIAIITNIPSPYRVDLFYYLQQNIKEGEIHTIYASRNEDNRKWEIEESKLVNSHFLASYTIKVPNGHDTKYIHISWGIKKILDMLQPITIIGSEYNPTALQALQYCRKKKIPYISWTDGTLHSERNINLIQKLLRKYVIKYASAYLASSSKAKEAQLFYGAIPDKCFISLLTVDIEKYKVQTKERERGRILYVGSLIKRKGIDLLFRALHGVKDDYTLVLAGNGPEEESLKQLAIELGIKKRVKFLGYLSQEELKLEYAKSSIFVLPTREDCFALVILEAMCAGLPIISSEYADGVYDLVKEGENGYIIDPYNKEQFRNRLQEFLQYPLKADSMGKNSLKYLQQFRFEKVSEGFWDVLSYVEHEV